MIYLNENLECVVVDKKSRFRLGKDYKTIHKVAQDLLSSEIPLISSSLENVQRGQYWKACVLEEIWNT